MHVLEVALLSRYLSEKNARQDCGEPMPEQWPRPRRSRAVTAFAWIAAFGVLLIVLGVAAINQPPSEATGRLEAGTD